MPIPAEREAKFWKALKSDRTMISAFTAWKARVRAP
jgi:hypothetical protein